MAVHVETEGEDGLFHFPESHERTTDKLVALLEAHDAGRVKQRGMLRRLNALAEQEPDHIDALAHLGMFLREANRLEEAGAACERAMGIGVKALPKDFTGRLEWSWLENRPFLRAAMGLALVRLDEGDRRAGIELLERILSWNPNDNQGVRLMIGSEYLRTGDETQARRVLQEHGAEYPAYRYELGLLHLRAKRWAPAATSLRHGFVENPYIAEILCNNVSPMPLPVWHGSNWNEPEAALDYTNRYGALWRSSPQAPRFVRWLYNHPKVMVERAAVLECLEEVLWEYDPDAIGRILDRARAARGRIDDVLSAEIVRQRIDRNGNAVLPWAVDPHLS